MVFHWPIKGSLEAKPEQLMVIVNKVKRDVRNFEFINRLTPRKMRERILNTIKA